VDILDDMGMSKLSAKVFFLKVNYSFNMKKKKIKPKLHITNIMTFAIVQKAFYLFHSYLSCILLIS